MYCVVCDIHSVPGSCYASRYDAMAQVQLLFQKKLSNSRTIRFDVVFVLESSRIASVVDAITAYRAMMELG